MVSSSKKTLKQIMIYLSIFMFSGLVLNFTMGNNLSLKVQDLSFQGFTQTSLAIFGIGINKYSDFFSHPETRIELDQNTRFRIFNLISEDEGIHLREVCRKLDKKMGVIQYHINVLEKAGLINSIKDGRYRRFFLNHNPNFDLKRSLIISVLKREPSFKILQFLLENDKVYHNDLTNLLKISSQAITWHIKRLYGYDLIGYIKEGKQKVYFIREDILPELKFIMSNWNLKANGSSTPLAKTPTWI